MRLEGSTAKRVRRRRHLGEEEERPRNSSRSSHRDPEALAGLQRGVGNRAVRRVLQSAGLLMRAKEGDKPDGSGDKARNTSQPGEGDGDLLQGPSARELAQRYPASQQLDDLDTSFEKGARAYLEALRRAGAKVDVVATQRPPERTYLMHWAWRALRERLDPRRIPAMPRLSWNWWRGDAARSRQAAEDVLEATGIEHEDQQPALDSLHNEGKAIDLRVQWAGDLRVRDGKGSVWVIQSLPRDETNKQLIALARTYGVVHSPDPRAERYHFSTDGR